MPFRKKIRCITVYSGTTLENYRKCASVDSRRRIIFNKKRERRHNHREFYFDESFNKAADYARYCASGRILEHKPLVMEGEVTEEDAEYGTLFNGKSFPIRRLWLPKAGFDWRNANYFMTDNVQQYFEELDPFSILTPETH